MFIEASGSDAQKDDGSLESSAEEHEHWKIDILQHVMCQLDMIPVTVKNGVRSSDARRQGLLRISLQLAQLASAIAKEGEARSGHAKYLTARQEEILLLLDKGLKPKEIAYQLTLSEATVRTHIRNARRVLDIRRPIRGERS